MKLKVEKREKLGSSASKQARLEKKVPGIVFGKDMESTPVLVIQKELEELLRKLGRNAVFNVDLDGKEKQVIIKNIDLSALKPEFFNVEMQAITKGQKITVAVNIVLEGAEELREGVLTQTLNELEIETTPNDIPTEITVNVKDMQIGDSIIVSELTVPENVTVLTDAEESVVVLSAPRTEEEVSEEAGEAVEPEVIGETKEEA